MVSKSKTTSTSGDPKFPDCEKTKSGDHLYQPHPVGKKTVKLCVACGFVDDTEYYGN